MEFLPTKKQLEAHTLLKDNRIVLYGGAVRGAKSFWGCLEVITFCLEHPRSRWLMLRKTLPVLKSTLLKTFRENFLEKGLSRYVKSFPENSLVLTWNNGSQILFMSENYDDDKELNRFKGLEINGAFIDEVNEIQEVTFNKIIERAGSWFHSPGCPTKIMMSCNPAGNWVKKRFYDKWKENQLPDGQKYIQAKIYDNPYVPEDYMQSLKMLPRYQYEVFVNGDWEVQIQTGNEFLSSFKIENHLTGFGYNPNYPVHISLDSNVWPYVAITVWQLIPNNNGFTIRQIEELHAPKPDNRASRAGAKIISWLTRIGNKERVHLYGDYSLKNANTIDEYGLSFFEIVQETLNQAGIMTVDKMRPHASPSTIGDFINAIFDGEIDGLGIEINEICKISINDYIISKKDQNGNIEKVKKAKTEEMPAHEENGHALDSMKDFIVQAFRAEYDLFINRFAKIKPGGMLLVNRVTGNITLPHGPRPKVRF